MVQYQEKEYSKGNNMPVDFFQKTFKNLQMPVIVCKDEENYPLVFANTSARLLCNPMLSVEKLKSNDLNETFDDFMRFQKKATRDSFFEALKGMGAVTGYKASLLTFDDEPYTVYLSSNMVDVDNEDFFVIYANESDGGGKLTYADVDNTIATAFQIAYQTNDTDEAINKILGSVGTYVDVSRVYIFEETSELMTANTYEWCNEGIEPAIQDLQSLAKADYNYNDIIESGMYITDDVRDLPDMDREILEAQGIKSLAILTLYGTDKPLGYVGFDDNLTYRKWGKAELQLLKGVSNILVALITQRNAVAQTKRSAEMVQTIMDKQAAIIYANDIETHKLVFVNQAFCEEMGVTKEEAIGKNCYEVIQTDMNKQCDFCPEKYLKDSDGNYTDETYTWDFQNTKTGKWYMAKDNVFPWIDGRMVHLESAVEITNKKEYERQLEYFASTDTLTGVHNREWGYQTIGSSILNPHRDTSKSSSLVFIDIDGLKVTNDKYGHDAGDNMLIETVNIIRNNIRKTDSIFRWGGDEFVLILEGVGDAAESVMGKIQNGIDEFNEKYNLPYELSFSYGITEFDPDSGDDIDTLINRADKLMYKQKMAKKKGRKS